MNELVITDVTLMIEDKDGNFVEVSGVESAKSALTDEQSNKSKRKGSTGSRSGEMILVCEDNSLHKLRIDLLVEEYFPITAPKGFNEPLTTDQVKDREYGWYRKFEKPNKKRNLRR